VYVCVLIYISLSFTGVVNHRTTPRHAKILYSNKGGFSRSYWLNHMWFPLLSYISRHRSPRSGRKGAPGKRRVPATEECRSPDLLQHETKKVRRVWTYVWFALVRELASVFPPRSSFTARYVKGRPCPGVFDVERAAREHGREISFGSSPLRSYTVRNASFTCK